MIAISFSPIYEDRVSIFLKNSNLKALGITYEFTDTPSCMEERKCYWIFKYQHSRQVNTILSSLLELKSIMGVDDMEFSYYYNMKEYYTQCNDAYGGGSIPWFKI